jgi:hypothetical protein
MPYRLGLCVLRRTYRQDFETLFHVVILSKYYHHNQVIVNSSHSLPPNPLISVTNIISSRGLLVSRGLIEKASLCWITLNEIIDLIVPMFDPPNSSLIYRFKRSVCSYFHGFKMDAMAGLKSRYN